MKIRFCGAARSVTGSCHMISANGKNVLVDCGMRQGADKKTELGEDKFPFNPAEIDAVLLTHAHIDHAGLIPLLVKQGFKGSIIATDATAQLSGIMLPDSGHIQEQEAEYQTRKNLRAGKAPAEPLYTVQDAQNALKQFTPTSYGRTVSVVSGITARFNDIGHLLGSSAIEIWVEENGKTTKLVFSGDIGREERPIICDPQQVKGADYLVIEGTYGDRNHEESTVEAKEAHLISVLKMGIARGGNIVIPSFAVGRTQELLYYIKRLLMKNSVPGLENVPVYIDSPLGINATKIYEKCAEGYYDEEAREMAKSGSPFDFPTLRVAVTADESKLINAQTGCNIIISSSGMCDAGRIRHHLKHNLWRPESAVVFVGFQSPGTLGRHLLDGAESVKMFGEEIAVRAKIVNFQGLSSHADRDHLLNWIDQFTPAKPTHVFVVHGDREVAPAFAADVAERGFAAHAPQYTEVYDLLENRIVEPGYLPEPKKKAFEGAPRVSSAYKRLAELGDALTALIRRSQGRDNKTLADFAESLRKILEKFKF